MNVLKEFNESQKNSMTITRHFVETLFLRIEQRLKASLKKMNGVASLFKVIMDNTHYFETERNVASLLAELQQSRL